MLNCCDLYMHAQREDAWSSPDVSSISGICECALIHWDIKVTILQSLNCVVKMQTLNSNSSLTMLQELHKLNVSNCVISSIPQLFLLGLNIFISTLFPHPYNLCFTFDKQFRMKTYV
jgi:hypothetical protein